MSEIKMVSVRNRSHGVTSYRLADSRIERTWQPRETKMISVDELQALQWEPGGDFLLKNILIVENPEVVESLNMKVEPEYYYTEDEIRKILFEGSLDELLDYLDFAPQGGIELIKHIAVAEVLPDTRKREAITNKTGFNIDSAIQINRMMEDETPSAEEEKKPAEGGRRVPLKPTTPKYKVVSGG